MLASRIDSLSLRDEMLHCPFCGPRPDNSDAMVHIGEVEVDCLGSITHIRSTGTTMRAGPKEHRGSTVSLRFWCECRNHDFVLRLQFHKGAVLAEIQEDIWCRDRSELPRD